MTSWRLDRNGRSLEVRARRSGLRTVATLWCDSVPGAEAGGLGRVLLPLPGPPESASPQVLVLAPLPGVMSRVVLLVPRPPAEDDGAPAVGADLPDAVGTALNLARAERHPFAPPPGTLPARWLDLQERHPRLWAARHVVLAVGRVLVALLGIAALVQMLLRPVLSWLAGLLPSIDLPLIPWPDIDLPSIPWPDLPDVSLPAWLVAVLDTAKYWGPILIGVVLAVREVRKKAHGTPAAPADGQSDEDAEEAAPDAHR